MSALVTIGTQAGVFNSRVVASYILDLLEKCHDIHEIFKKCTHDLQEGRARLDHQEQTIDEMQTTVKGFGATLDCLGDQMLQSNMAITERDQQIERLRKEIATKRNLVETRELLEQEDVPRKNARLAEMKDQRKKLEMQLRKLNRDIDDAYEDMFETQEKLYAMKDMREIRQEDESKELVVWKGRAENSSVRKREILTVTDDKILDMSDMYVNQASFTALQAEIEALKHQQIQVQRHIQMQLDERSFLRETANAVVQRVFDLEKKVRKETGDHGWDTVGSTEPNWLWDLSGPSIWYASPPLTLDQLSRLRERQYRRQNQNQSFSRAISYQDETEAASRDGAEDVIVIDISREPDSDNV